MEWNKKCPICGCYTQLKITYMHGVPHTVPVCPVCGEKEYVTFTTFSTNPDEPFYIKYKDKEGKNENT